MSVVFALAAAELLARQFFIPVSPVMNDWVADYYERHQLLGWVPRKNIVGVHRKEGSFDTTFRTNSRGLRDREHELAKAPTTTRIVVIGDSFTWGRGVQDDEVYPRVIESLLPQTEVINLGVTAFNNRQEFDYLEIEGMLYQPDTVILGFCLNDIYLSNTRRASQVDDRSTPATPSRPQESVGVRGKQWLTQHVALYQLAQQAVNTNRTIVKTLVRVGVKESLAGFDELDVNLMPALRVYPPKLQDAFERTKAELGELQRFLQERNVRFILVLIPSLQSIDSKAFRSSISYSIFEESDFDLGRPYRLLEDFARESGIEVVNPYEALRSEHNAGTTLYLERDLHFNRFGQRALAREIAEYLTKHPTASH